MKNKVMLRSTAISTRQYAEPKSRMKTVKTYPKVEFEASDVPELAGKTTGHECLLIMKVKKVAEGQEESWNSPNPEKPRNMIKVEILGTMQHESKEHESIEEGTRKRRHESGY